MKNWARSLYCGEVRATHAGQVVTLNGWVDRRRDLGGLIFVHLRDRQGIAQVVFNPERFATAHERAKTMRPEFVVAVRGEVCCRPPGTENRDLPTGEMEVVAQEAVILNEAKTPVFPIEDETDVAEDIRLTYRYLDLRRAPLQRNLRLRHRFYQVTRRYLDGQGFLEVETPVLTRSTPEGARDYLVPSRVNPGEFFALPQSPQLFKQLLMISGFDRYFQIVKCFRDEDLRADRQPEFTQLDLEMSFVEMDDVFRVIEALAVDIFQKCLGVEIKLPLPRMKYVDVMLKYGSDKPDLRYGLEIVDVTPIMQRSTFKVFLEAIAKGSVVRGLNAKGAADKFSNTDLKPGGKLAEFVAQYGAKGLAWFKVDKGKLTSSLEKFFDPALLEELGRAMGAENGDALLFVADKEDVVCQALGNLRVHLANLLKLFDPDKLDYKIVWVIDFPSFIWDDDNKRWAANHHPFTAPMDDDLAKLESDTGKVRAKAYDLVINGYEVGGGSIRIHNPDVQSRLFAVLGMSPEQARQRFGFLLDALKYGAPPHGGIALGLDRWAMLIARTANIRDVIAFPKNQKARDLMTGAPAPVDAKQLKELGL